LQRYRAFAWYSLRKGRGLVGAPGGRVVATKGEWPHWAPFADWSRDRLCDPVTRRRVIVDRHPLAEQPDGPRHFPKRPKLLKPWEQRRHRGERPTDEGGARVSASSRLHVRGSSVAVRCRERARGLRVGVQGVGHRDRHAEPERDVVDVGDGAVGDPTKDDHVQVAQLRSARAACHAGMWRRHAGGLRARAGGPIDTYGVRACSIAAMIFRSPPPTSTTSLSRWPVAATTARQRSRRSLRRVSSSRGHRTFLSCSA